MANKKHPNYIKDIIEDVNFYLRMNKVKDESDTLFMWLCHYLMDKGMYQGFNYHKYGDKIANEITGERVVILAGSYEKDKFDFLQVW